MLMEMVSSDRGWELQTHEITITQYSTEEGEGNATRWQNLTIFDDYRNNYQLWETYSVDLKQH
jgi:hypothetical protein